MVEYPTIEETNYFTKRDLSNEKGEATGNIVMWRLKGKKEFHYVMKCPYCGTTQEKERVFEKRPYRPVCQNCGKVVLVERIFKKQKAKGEG